MKEILKRASRSDTEAAQTEPPDTLWIRCPRCKELLYTREHEQRLHVCSKCKYHFRVAAPERIALTLDAGTFRERDARMTSVDPLRFTIGGKSYADKLVDSVRSTGQIEAFLYGSGEIEGLPLVIGAMGIEFIGGSMGAVVGEKVARAIELAVSSRIPLVLFSTSGGARMQEGVVALMQMAKALSALEALHEERLPFISVMTDPCYGGVTASFAMSGDVNIAEPGAYVGFAGPRVIEQTTRQKLPPGAATAEFLRTHGMIDLVVPRSDMRPTLARLLRVYTLNRQTRNAEERLGLRVGV